VGFFISHIIKVWECLVFLGFGLFVFVLLFVFSFLTPVAPKALHCGTVFFRWGMMSPSQSDREDEERNIDRPHSFFQLGVLPKEQSVPWGE
jgi:hypothetical protein